MIKAVFSKCKEYRYVLRRKLEGDGPPALFIMLNPSTADEVNNDPTIRRCIGFATDMGCSELTVVNLYALRSTDPRGLAKHKEPIGPLNDRYIRNQINKHKDGVIIAAWGAHKFAQERGLEVIRKFGPFKCLGLTKDGFPKHPLYLRSDSKLIEVSNEEK